MDITQINDRGLVMLGCGKMGSAMLAGWLSNGVDPRAVTILEPKPSILLADQCVRLNEDLPTYPACLVLAVKPQMMGAALPGLAEYAGSPTLILSVAAGTSIASFEEVFTTDSPIIRAMPNTPAAIGQGVTAVVGNATAEAEHLALAETLLGAVGQVVRLSDEAQMDAVTGLSGSGPAYVFHMIECMTEAGVAEGLDADLALSLARATVAGAGALALADEESPAELRVNVTSPGGTTQAGLEVLMHNETGLAPLMRQTIAAAAARSRALKSGGA